MRLEVEIFSFPPGSSQYIPATLRLRRLLRHRPPFDLVHAHYGLPGWCARFAGARPLVVSFHGTDVRHPIVGRALTPSGSPHRFGRRRLQRSLFLEEDGRPGLPLLHRLCRPALRTRPEPLRPACPASRRASSLASTATGATCSSPPTRTRPEKRADRAAELAAACDAELLSGGSIEPEQMRLWINAANAVIVTSDYEGFGMVCLEALACEVPVLSTPVGIAPFALGALPVPSALPMTLATWTGRGAPLTSAPDPRVAGAARAEASPRRARRNARSRPTATSSARRNRLGRP